MKCTSLTSAQRCDAADALVAPAPDENDRQDRATSQRMSAVYDAAAMKSASASAMCGWSRGARWPASSTSSVVSPPPLRR